MKTLAELAREDRKITSHCWRAYKMTPEHARNKRTQELAAEGFRIERKEYASEMRRTRHKSVSI